MLEALLPGAHTQGPFYHEVLATHKEAVPVEAASGAADQTSSTLLTGQAFEAQLAQLAAAGNVLGLRALLRQLLVALTDSREHLGSRLALEGQRAQREHERAHAAWTASARLREQLVQRSKALSDCSEELQTVLARASCAESALEAERHVTEALRRQVGCACAGSECTETAMHGLHAFTVSPLAQMHELSVEFEQNHRELRVRHDSRMGRANYVPTECCLLGVLHGHKRCGCGLAGRVALCAGGP